ncbi:fimbria/pilus outer membrane usher protein [Klebsiella oxytoca]|uniref:fimbria/pilus outer membrane usher protein n=1 Tax=Klebsiella oxytoca TaxID=571 RepID=UPI0022474C98|nr:fimbria/pilus outer membrane usher protein [Klebsiella oxytoca]MCW9498919.1 fimbrial biogenesis outer membrane usher protein [Klebsiella oxytoca]HCU2530999.1 fimbrial biogenesis outer membrane usher protein [Klebsiella oxytoca]
MRLQFGYSLIAIAVMAAIMTPRQVVATSLSSSPANEDNLTFDPIFLNTSGEEKIDLSRFENGGSATPGTWSTDIFVNGESVTQSPVLFAEQADKKVRPCMTAGLIKNLNLNFDKVPASFTTALRENRACYNLEELLPGVSIIYDSSTQRLDVEIPQALLRNTARGYVSPALWDTGIPAALLGYNASTYTTRSHGRDYTSSYIGLNGGLNIGGWYFRHDGNYSWQQSNGGQYQSINNYVQKDISSILGRVLLGETSTGGQLFDTLPFRGVELVSDDRMLPQSRRGYAPDIRGIARTNARVTVRQNDRIIYETTVPPGAFVIEDLYPTGYGGNLDVKVTEADGSVQSFQVPYASVTQLLRPGAHRYDVVAGRLNDPSLSFNPTLYQATYQRGLSNILTGYTGIQGSGAAYYAVQLGMAISTAIGAFSVDVTQARVHLKTTDETANSGQSYQVSYSKYLPDTDSNLTIAAYRFSTSGYYDFQTAMRAIDEEKRGGLASGIWRPKNRLNITMNQGLGPGWGQVYVTGYTQDYWNNGKSDIQYQMGYSNNFGRVNYNLSAGRVRNYSGKMENNFLLNISTPLGGYDKKHVPMLTASLNKSGNGRMGEQLGLSGTYGEDNQYNYGMTAANYNQGTGSSMTASGGWRTPYSHLTASYGAGKHYQNTSLAASGTVIAWQNGVVATPYTGDTFAVVEAKDAKGAKVGGYPGLKIDRFGHAAIPYLTPYEMNEVSIDPKGLSQEVELSNTTEKVAPHWGAVSKVVFNTRKGIPLLISAKNLHGEPLPFGAEVFDASGASVGNVGQMGQIYALTEAAAGQLTVKWGSKDNEQCRITYRVNDEKPSGFRKLTETCK